MRKRNIASYEIISHTYIEMKATSFRWIWNHNINLRHNVGAQKSLPCPQGLWGCEVGAHSQLMEAVGPFRGLDTGLTVFLQRAGGPQPTRKRPVRRRSIRIEQRKRRAKTTTRFRFAMHCGYALTQNKTIATHQWKDCPNCEGTHSVRWADDEEKYEWKKRLTMNSVRCGKTNCTIKMKKRRWGTTGAEC